MTLTTARHIAVIRYDGLGDLVLTSGFLRELRRANPDAKITLVVRGEFVELVRHCPYVSNVAGFALRPYPRIATIRRQFDAMRFASEFLRRQKVDCVLVPQLDFTYFDARPMALLSGAPLRIGGSRSDRTSDAHLKEMRCFFNHLVPSTRGLHEADRCLEFLEALGARIADRTLELWCRADIRARAAAFADQLRKGEAPLVAIAPGASQTNRIWPVDRFASIASWLVAEFGTRVVILGATDAAGVAAALHHQVKDNVTNCVGQLSLTETAALLEHCDLFIGNDSGPMHLAAAAGIPVVEISGWPPEASRDAPSAPERIGPFCAQKAIVRPPPANRTAGIYMSEISVKQVQAAVETLLHYAQSTGGPPNRLKPAAN